VRAQPIEVFELVLNMSDGDLVIVGFGQGNVTQVVDRADLPWGELERLMGPAQPTGYVSHGSRPEVLIALGRAVARTMWNSHQADVAILWIFVPGTFEESWNAVPIPMPHLGATRLDFFPSRRHREPPCHRQDPVTIRGVCEANKLSIGRRGMADALGLLLANSGRRHSIERGGRVPDQQAADQPISRTLEQAVIRGKMSAALARARERHPTGNWSTA
jgi:hypothetical protein